MGAGNTKQKWPVVKLPADRTVVVTGSNTGIGYEMAKHMALMGARVILACRTEAKAIAAMMRIKADLIEYKATDELPFGYTHEELPDEVNVEYMKLDLSSLKSVMEFVTEYRSKGYPLHVLICNAGIVCGPQVYTDDEFESHFQVNYLSHFLLTVHLLPVMRQSGDDCRIVSVSSSAHTSGSLDLNNMQCRKNYNRQSSYGNSKLYQIMHMFALTRRLENTNISVVAFHPGAVLTDSTKTFQDDKFLTSMLKMGKAFGTVKTDRLLGAATGINAAVNPNLKGMTGLYYVNCYPVTPSQRARDLNGQEVLWRYSLDCLKDYVTSDLLADLTCDVEALNAK